MSPFLLALLGLIKSCIFSISVIVSTGGGGLGECSLLSLPFTLLFRAVLSKVADVAMMRRALNSDLLFLE